MCFNGADSCCQTRQKFCRWLEPLVFETFCQDLLWRNCGSDLGPDRILP